MNRQIVTSIWILAIFVVLVSALLPFDDIVSLNAQALPKVLVHFNRRITDFGTFAWMIYSAGFVVVVAFIARRIAGEESTAVKARTGTRLGLYFLFTIGTASIFVHTVKFLIGRARPELFAEVGAYSLAPFTGDNLFESFPSGHSTAVGAFFGAFSMLVPRFRLVFLTFAIVLGASRVIVGAHYPSDVAAGLLLGLWTAIMTAFAFARKNWLFFEDESGWPLPKKQRQP